ncbi:MAG: hypothetical protein WCD07_06335 [Burkholderiales bacterium]
MKNLLRFFISLMLAACGALHLYGDRGMLRLLEQQGFKITQIY